jgi:hypothetical protein
MERPSAWEDATRSLTTVRVPRDVRRLTNEIRRRDRRSAVVALTAPGENEQPAFAPGAIWMALAEPVPIYILASPYICWRFADSIGATLAVDGGSARVWWPGVTTESDPTAHPLVRYAPNEEPTARLERFVKEYELSRPTVRQYLRPIQRNLQTAEQTAAKYLRERDVARSAAKAAAASAETITTRLDRAEKQLRALRDAGLSSAEMDAVCKMDHAERLHRLISREWLNAMNEADRQAHPFGKYKFGPRFLDTVKKLEGLVSAERVAFVCSMVACGRAGQLRGLDARQLKTRATSQDRRDSQAKPWLCKVGEGGGAPRMEYWTLPDHVTEFCLLHTHDAIGRQWHL